MTVVGLPVGYVLWALGLRVAGASFPWAAPANIVGATLLLTALTEPLEPSTVVWPIVMAVMGGAWSRFGKSAD